MLFLDKIHPALIESVNRIVSGQNEVPTCAVRDFDGNEFMISVSENAAYIIISMKHALPGKFIEEHAVAIRRHILLHFGLVESLDPAAAVKVVAENAPIIIPETPAPGMAATVHVRVEDPNRTEWLQRVSQLREVVLRAVFVEAFEQYLHPAIPAGAKGAPKVIEIKPVRLSYRLNESLYCFTSKGNFMVCLSFVVQDRDDRMFVRQFLQEFSDAKKHEKSIAAGPGFFFCSGRAPADLPAELVGESQRGGATFDGEDSGTDSVFWCTFQLFRKHMEPLKNAEKTVLQLINFRNYVLYHISCCKAYMHAKMRKRVDSSLLVLNRAKTATTGKAKITIK